MPVPAAPPAQGQVCLHNPALWERTQGQDKGPLWGRAEVLPEPWLSLSCQNSSFYPSLLGDQKVTSGCRTWKCPHQLPARGGRDNSQGGVCMAGNLSYPAMECSITTKPEVALQELAMRSQPHHYLPPAPPLPLLSLPLPPSCCSAATAVPGPSRAVGAGRCWAADRKGK